MATKPNQALIYKKVPAFLRNLRKVEGLTQRGLATRIGKTQWWVARIESGSRRIDVAEFIEWCKGCHVAPADALTELSESKSPAVLRRRKDARS
jgi:transcriptional regulator with XRE-family HTH domain